MLAPSGHSTKLKREKEGKAASTFRKKLRDYFFLEVSSEIVAPADEKYGLGQRAFLGYPCRWKASETLVIGALQKQLYFAVAYSLECMFCSFDSLVCMQRACSRVRVCVCGGV